MSDPGHQPSSRQMLNERIGSAAFERGLGLAAHRPAHVYLQIASGCNLDCYMCSEHNRPVEARHGRGLVSLAPELFEKVAREVFPWSYRVTIGLGGEPSLSPHFLRFLARAHECDQEITVLTNGTRLAEPDTSETIARCVSLLQVSLDGATRETYERIRRGSSWAGTRARLAHFNAARCARPEGRRTTLSLQYVLMRSNVHEMRDFVELASEFEADRIEFQHVIPITAEGKGETLFGEPERFATHRAEALARAAELGIEVIAPAPYANAASAPPEAPAVAPDAPVPAETTRTGAVEAVSAGKPLNASSQDSELSRVRCSMPTMQVFVFYDGRVFPCCHPFAHQTLQVGDLRTSSFAEIWNGRLYRNLRAGLFRGDAPEICRTCSIAHDPPPAREDPDRLAAAPDLAAYYGERELEPLDGRSPALLAQMAELGLLDYVAHLEAVERERAAAEPPVRPPLSWPARIARAFGRHHRGGA